MLATTILSVKLNNSSITDQVKDDLGNPVAGALVILCRQLLTINQVITDASGIYKFENLPEAEYRVEIIIPGTPVLNTKDIALETDYVASDIVLDTTPADISLVVGGNGKSVSATVVSGGTGYSTSIPFYVTADDGYIGLANIDPATGSITSVETILEGSGSFTEIEVNSYDGKLPNFIGSQTYGTATTQTVEQVNELYTIYNNLQSTVGEDYTWATNLRYGSQVAWYLNPPGGHSIRGLGELIAKIHYSTNVQGTSDIPTTPSLCLAYIRTGDIRVYANSASDLLRVNQSNAYQLIASDDGGAGGTSRPSYMDLATWEAVLCEQPHDQNYIWPGGGTEWFPILWNQEPTFSQWYAQHSPGGYFDTFHAFAKQQAVSNTIQRRAPIDPVVTEPTPEKLSSFLDTMIGLLIFKSNKEELINAGNLYASAMSVNYTGAPAKDDLIPITITNNTGSSGLTQLDPYTAINYGIGLNNTSLTLGDLYYPYLNASGNPTSTNTGRSNPNWDPTITRADFEQAKGYLGVKYLPEPVLNSIGLGTLFNKIQSFDSTYGTAFAPSFAWAAAVTVVGLHEAGQVVGANKGGTSWAQEYEDFKNQVLGATTLTAPSVLHNRSFLVEESPANESFAFRHSWDSVGAYTITKVAK